MVSIAIALMTAESQKHICTGGWKNRQLPMHVKIFFAKALNQLTAI
jgi:hypothetical protein